MAHELPDDDKTDKSLDQHQSVYREQLLEHLLVGELLRHAWLRDQARLEVAKPEIDRAGYDIVLEAHRVVRHVQLKSSSITAKTARQNVHIDLAGKPSGCVVWTRFDAATLRLGPFLFFGARPGEPLPSLEGLSTARHVKADSAGLKALRPNLRVVPRNRFIEIATVEELYVRLFGL